MYAYIWWDISNNHYGVEVLRASFRYFQFIAHISVGLLQKSTKATLVAKWFGRMNKKNSVFTNKHFYNKIIGNVEDTRTDYMAYFYFIYIERSDDLKKKTP